MVSTLQIDGEIENTALLTVEEVEALSMLEPYGAGNPKPVFSLSGVTITCMSDVGGGRHLKMRASRDGRTVDMIFFSVTRAKSGLTVGTGPTWLSTPRSTSTGAPAPCSSTWWTCARLTRPSSSMSRPCTGSTAGGEPLSPCEARMMIPQREEFAAVWRYLANRDGEVVEVPASLARKVAQEGDLWGVHPAHHDLPGGPGGFDLVTLRPEEGGALSDSLAEATRKGQGGPVPGPHYSKAPGHCLGRREKKSFELIRGAAHVPEPVRRAGARRERDGLWKTSWRLVFRSWKRN